jgi:CubicO group peptidase (beta-lactamase class C family)
MAKKRDFAAEIARRHVGEGRFASVEWLATRRGKTWASGRAGMADPENGVKLPENPIYRIYSMTKPIVSAIAMMLLEEGRLRLYDPVGAFVPEFASPRVLGAEGKQHKAGRPMLVEHLLTHQSGLSYGFLLDCPVAALYRTTDLRSTHGPLADFVRTIAQFPLAFEPGTQWRYSVATDVLARVIEIVTGKPIQEVVRERVTAPLGLEDTGFFVKPKQRKRIVPAFGQQNLDRIQEFPPGPQKLTPADVSNVYPCDDEKFGRGGYGLFSTTQDYLVIARFLATGKAPDGMRLLSRKSVQLMWTNRIPSERLPLMIGAIGLPGFGFALAGRVLLDPGRALVLGSAGEFGWAGAASTFFLIDPAEDLILVVMSQYLGATVPLIDDMRNAIYAMLD